MTTLFSKRSGWRCGALLAGLGLLGLAGCQAPSTRTNLPIGAPPKELVQAEAFEELKRLTGELEQAASAARPGITALAADLRAAFGEVETTMGVQYDRIDAERLIRRNPNFWRASLEFAADDSLPGALEVLALATAGQLEEAADALEFLRAGPLMPEALDRPLLVQGHWISQWQGGPPAEDVWSLRGATAQERWAPLKRLQQLHPESALVAWELLRMRCDLADIALIGKPTDESMRARILELEPQAFEVLEEKRPLWARIIETRGEAGDAAQRIARRLTGDQGSPVVLTADDLAELVADFERIGEPAWALRAARMQAGVRGGMTPSDRAAWELLLPQLVGAEAAAGILADWPPAATPAAVALYPAEKPPAGPTGLPTDELVAGYYERMRREAGALIDDMETPDVRLMGAYRWRLQVNRTLGNYAAAEADLNEYAVRDTHTRQADLERLQLAILRGDEAAVSSIRVNLRRAFRTAENRIALAMAPVMLGDWAEAEKRFKQAHDTYNAGPRIKGYAALYAHAAAVLDGGDRNRLLRAVIAENEPDDWITRVLRAALGEISREVILEMATEESDYETVGRACEAHFALAFAPGQTDPGRRAELEACLETGVIGFVEYDFALLWLRRTLPGRF